MKSADIKTRKWSEAERRELEVMASAQAVGDDSGIDYSDAPALSDEQLAAMAEQRISGLPRRNQRS